MVQQNAICVKQINGTIVLHLIFLQYNNVSHTIDILSTHLRALYNKHDLLKENSSYLVTHIVVNGSVNRSMMN